MKRRKTIDGGANAESDTPDTKLHPDGKESGGSGLNITAVKHPEFRHRKSKK